MVVEEYLDIEGPDTIRLVGHRLQIEDIVRLFREGYSAEQIALEYPGISLDQIYFTIAYYLRHRAEIDALMARLDAESEARYQQWLSDPNGGQRPLIQRLRALQAKMESRPG